MEANFTNNGTVQLGSKYYNDDHLYRVLAFKNSETARVLDLVTKEVLRIPIEELKKDYTLLLPDAAISFCIVGLADNLEDVIVTMNRFSDLNEGVQIPYCVCRQNVRDLHANIVKTDFLKHNFVGCSISIDTCPPEVDYNIMLACNSINFSTILYTYCDDSLEDMLMCIPHIDKYDRVLDDLYRSYAKVKHLPVSKESDGIHGYCSTLRKLLVDNNFMYDFRAGLGIWSINTTMKVDNANKIEPVFKESIEIMVSHRMMNEICVKYHKDVDLDLIKRSYVLIADANDDIYLIVYDKGLNIAYDPDRDLIIKLDTEKYYSM